MAALLFGEPKAGEIDRRIHGSRLFAPALLDYELANVCWQKARRHPQQAAELAEAFRLRRRLAISDVPVDLDGALHLAGATGLTAYDASYLWVARHLKAELVTLDRQLVSAAASTV